MLDVIHIEMQTSDAAANRHRAWRIEVGQDLFDQWGTRVTYGRIGRVGPQPVRRRPRRRCWS